MKPLQIDFIQRRYWIAVWLPAIVICLAIGTATAIRWDHYRIVLRETQSSLLSTQQKLQQLRAPQAITTDPRALSATQTAKLLQQDMNVVFSVLENLKEPNMRLRNLSLDMGSENIRLEYELDSMARASSVTAALNAGFDTAPWRLESLSGGSSGLTQTAASIRGQWATQIDKLK